MWIILLLERKQDKKLREKLNHNCIEMYLKESLKER